MILYELLEGQVHISVQNMWQTRGVQGYAPQEMNLDILLDALW